MAVARNLAVVILTTWLLLIFLSTPAEGLMHNLKIRDDRRLKFFIENFGFEGNGKLLLKATNLEIQPARHGERVGFIVTYSQTDEQSFIEKNTNVPCLFDAGLRFPQVKWQLKDGKEEFNLDVRTDYPGFYGVYFVACLNEGSSVSLNVNLTMLNPGPNFLDAGDSVLPGVYMLMLALYAVCLLIWLAIYLFPATSAAKLDGTNTGNQRKVLLLHWLMTVALVLKMLSLLFHSVELHYLKIVGHPGKWSYVYYLFSLLRGLSLFLVIAMIGSGWALFKPFMTDRDKKLILSVLLLQVFANIARIALDEGAPGSIGWFAWKDIFTAVDAFCIILILVPLMWSINHLKKAAASDGKSARNLQKLRMFQLYYIVVIVYFYTSRVVSYILLQLLRFRWTWVGPMFEEAMTLCFMVTTGYLFRPEANNEYIKVEKEESQGTSPNSVEV